MAKNPRSPKQEDSFQQFVMDQLHDLPGMLARGMFGGYGLYQNEVFFGIIHKSRLYFKTNDMTKDKYVEYGMKAFRPNERQTLKTYYEVPADVIDDSGQLLIWAEEAIRCQSR